MSDTQTKRTVHRGPLVVIVFGLILIVGSIFADTLGITWGGDGYGWKQLLATIAGLAISAAGVGWWMRYIQFPAER